MPPYALRRSRPRRASAIESTTDMPADRVAHATEPTIAIAATVCERPKARIATAVPLSEITSVRS